jgi:hypothetical protein
MTEHPPPMATILVSIDPGKTTGVCLVSCNAYDREEFTVLESRAFIWTARFQLYEWIQSVVPEIIVMESFHLYASHARQMIGSAFESCQIIGAVEYLAHRMNVRIDYQPASEIQFVTIAFRHVGSIGNTEHQKDAYKHARYWHLSQCTRNVKPARLPASTRGHGRTR